MKEYRKEISLHVPIRHHVLPVLEHESMPETFAHSRLSRRTYIINNALLFHILQGRIDKEEAVP